MESVILRTVATVSLVLLPAIGTPTYALSPVTFVSPGGSDSDNCLTPATACREIGGINGAIGKTESGGTIRVSPGSYQAFDLFGSRNIYADEGQASIDKSSVTVPGLGAVSIGISADSFHTVRIRGFTLNPQGSGVGIYTSGTGGGGIIHLENCNFAAPAGSGIAGVEYAPKGASELYITDSAFKGPGVAVLVNPGAGGSPRVVLNGVDVENANAGVAIDGRFTAGANRVTITDTVIAGGGSGILILEDPTGSTNVTIEDSSVSGSTTAVSANGATTTVRVANSRIMLNNVGLLAGSGGKIISNGGNVLRGNTTNGSFTATEAQQ